MYRWGKLDKRKLVLDDIIYDGSFFVNIEEKMYI